jgi:uncharacterized BrkB/YihY/UPF0761 family membrane protein
VIRATKICGVIIAILLFIWIADYGFILVSEKSTIAVVIGVLILLGLLFVAIAGISWFVKKIVKKIDDHLPGSTLCDQTDNAVAGDQAGRDIKKKTNSKKEEKKKCCG